MVLKFMTSTRTASGPSPFSGNCTSPRPPDIYQDHNPPSETGIEASIGTVGDSYDNALAENFWSVLKIKCVRRTTFATRTDADLGPVRL